MKKIKVVRITKEERDELTKQWNSQKDPDITLEELLESNDNQTLNILRQIKNVVEWDDIEDMVNYVGLIKKSSEAKEYLELDNDDYKLVMDVFSRAAKSKKIAGFGMEKLIQVYEQFKGAK